VRRQTDQVANKGRPSIVLVPGFMTDDDLWADLIPKLEDYEVFCATTSTGTSLESIAAHILEQCPPTFTLLGFSLGGYVARYMAYQAAERVTSLVLVATSGRPSPPASRIAPAGSAAFKGLSVAAVRASLGPYRARDAELVGRIQRMGARLGPSVYARLSSLDRPSDLGRLKEIVCKCLVVYAKHDKLRSRVEAQELADGLQAELVEIQDCGHMIPLEKPSELANAIHQWSERTWIHPRMSTNDEDVAT
jgi:pimeloyl-ACP methyl ester carboxylesterase